MLDDLHCFDCSSCLAYLIQAKGGALAFLKGEPSEPAITDGIPSQKLLAYINGDREYVILHPYGKEARELSTTQDDLVFEETGVMTFILFCSGLYYSASCIGTKEKSHRFKFYPIRRK